jgi:hypothetical protein
MQYQEKAIPDAQDMHYRWRLAEDGEELPLAFAMWDSIKRTFDLAGSIVPLEYQSSNMVPIAVPKDRPVTPFNKQEK